MQINLLVMSDISGNDSILSGLLQIKSQNGFNIKQNPKKVSEILFLKNASPVLSDVSFSFLSHKQLSLTKILTRENYNKVAV